MPSCPLAQKIFPKILICLAGVFLFFGIRQNISQGQITIVSIQPVSQSLAIGSQVLVNVAITDVQDLYSCQISLSYDPNILEYQGVTEGAFLNQNGEAATFHLDPKISLGSLQGYAISRVGIVPGVNGTGTLATFRFTAIRSGTSAITLATDPVGIRGTKLKDSEIREITYTKNDGQVTIGSGGNLKPLITLSKQVDFTVSEVGRTLVYTINYKNSGDQQAQNVLITDTIPPRTTYINGSATPPGYLSNGQIIWDVGTVPVGASGAMNFSVQITN